MKKYQRIITTVLIILLIIALIVIGNLTFKNYKLKKQASNNNAPSPSSISTQPSPTSYRVTISSPAQDSLVTSPLTVTGTVPSGWMFEGQLALKLLDSNRKLIVQAIGKEKVPGSWQSEEPVEFTGTLNFKTSDMSGILLIEADNPSGLPENVKVYEIPVKFK